MSILADELLRETDDGHVFIVISLPYACGWLDVLAKKYIEMRSQIETVWSQVSLDGLGGFSTDYITARIKEATIPYPEEDERRRNFSIVRSDLGEALNYVLLEQSYGTRFASNLVTDRELSSFPGRGIDAIGIEEDAGRLRLIFSEVKVSNENVSPPSVVDGGDKSMHHQHLGHIGDPKVTADKIITVATKARDRELQALFMCAALLFQYSVADLDVIAHCFLVRPDTCYTSADFGKFKQNPSAYAPAKVRFAIACVPKIIDDVEADWYEAIVRVGGLDRE